MNTTSKTPLADAVARDTARIKLPAEKPVPHAGTGGGNLWRAPPIPQKTMAGTPLARLSAGPPFNPH
jgi:hypothetical protein